MGKNVTSPAAPETPQLVITLPALVAGIAEIEAIDTKLSETLGTIGKIMNEAKTATLASPAGDASGIVEGLPDSPSWAELIEALEAARTATLEAFEAAVVAEAGDTQVTHKATVEALLAERAAKYSVVAAMHSLMTSMASAFPGIDKVVLPSATKGTSSGSTKASGTPSAKGVSVYVVKDDGGRYFYAKGSPLALVGLRAFKASAEAFKAALVEAGVDVSGPWEPVKITLNGETKMVGAVKAEEAAK